MSRYLLPCPACSQSFAVGIAQAGSTVPCPHCGQVVDVPGTRQLRSLPPAVEDRAAPAKGGGNRRLDAEGGSIAFRLLTAGLLLASCSGLAYGGYLLYLRWNAPIIFGHTEEELYQEMMEKSLADPPATVWDHWNFLVDAGIPDPSPPPYFLYSRMYEEQKPWMIGSLAVGAVSLVAFLALSWLASKRVRSQR